MKMAKITKDMIILDVLRMDPDSAQIFFKHGMHCVGCPASSGESIEEASAVHGMNSEKLLKDLNNYFEEA
jgi:hybrid cluster-associated redox disulfide protein